MKAFPPVVEIGMEQNQISTEWRRYGERRRKEIVEADEVEGRTSFHLNRQIPIRKYFRLAERVTGQFRIMCSNLEPSNLESTYVMGHRLTVFLSQALPKHPEYLHRSVVKNKTRTFRDLVWINDLMEEIAVKIDEEQLSHYITNEFIPEPGFDDDSSSRSSSTESNPNNWGFQEVDAPERMQWESFPGWSFDISSSSSCGDLPHITDTDTSTSSCSEFNASRDMGSDSEMEDLFHRSSDFAPCLRQEPMDEERHDAVVTDRDDLVDFPDQPDLPDFYEENEDDEEGSDDAVGEEDEDEDHLEARYSFRDALHVSEFLRKIANEDVRYETDSEAADSWAQDGGDVTEKMSSSSGVLTCDPARIAFREIMNHLGSSRKLLDGGSPPRTPPRSPLSRPPQPHDTPEEAASPPRELVRKPENSYSWASFDFASVRQVS